MEAKDMAGQGRAVSVAQRLSSADIHCARERLQFTPARRRVLEILLAEQRALGAYDILDRLKAEGYAAQPPVAYRALDFLVKHGFVHRIERLNAYLACLHPGQPHSPAFLICRLCDSVSETISRPAGGMLEAAARETGFVIEKTVVEVIGICPACRLPEPN